MSTWRDTEADRHARQNSPCKAARRATFLGPLLRCLGRPGFQQGVGGQGQGKLSPKFGLEGEPRDQAPPPQL